MAQIGGERQHMAAGVGVGAQGFEGSDGEGVLQRVGCRPACPTASPQARVRADFVAADAARALRIERLSNEADLAERRYGNVDPGNRLVAAKLETAWTRACARCRRPSGIASGAGRTASRR